MVIEKSNERGIFLINHQGFNYYIIIPGNVSGNVQFLLSITDNVNENMVRELPLLNDKIVVLPIVNEQIISYLKSYQSNYDQGVYYFLNMIYNAYGLLKHNNMNIEPQKVVLLNNNENFSNFNDYFVVKSSGKIQKSDRDLLKKEMPSVVNTHIEQSANNINSDIPVNMNAYPIKDEIIPEDSLEQEMGKTRVKRKDERGEPGFVSYVLLGVVIAILSLVFLYMLI